MRPHARLRAAAAAAAATAALLALALAWRPQSSFDLGYHLEYGAEFWRTGRPVDDAHGIVPPPVPGEVRGDLPPGARFDDRGRYTFPNANWASQALFALAHRLGGANGLAGLGIVLLGAILALQALAVRRTVGTWLWTGPMWLATALTGYERFTLRPELAGNLCLVAQLALLAKPLTLRRAWIWLAVQIVAVNVHSYWLLGTGVLAAAALDAALRARRSPRPARARQLAIAGMAAACLLAGAVHPAGFRNWTLPIETLAYMRAHHIGNATPEGLRDLASRGLSHPWQDTGELYRTIASGTLRFCATQAFLLLLAAVAPAAFVLARRGRPGLALVLVAVVLSALPVRRNLATAGFGGWPLVAIAACWSLSAAAATRGAHSLRQARRARGAQSAPAPAAPRLSRLAPLALAAVAAAGAAGTASVVSNHFYTREGRDARFGAGWSDVALPIETCAWLDANLSHDQAVFANFNVSSAVLFFSKRVTGVPILSNAWAVPPSRKQRLLDMQLGREWIDPYAREAKFDVAIFYALPSIRPLLGRMAIAPDWALVHLDGPFVVFVRRTSEMTPLVARSEIRRTTLDVQGLATRARALDPTGDRGLRATAGALAALGWDDHARALLGVTSAPPRR